MPSLGGESYEAASCRVVCILCGSRNDIRMVNDFLGVWIYLWLVIAALG